MMGRLGYLGSADTRQLDFEARTLIVGRQRPAGPRRLDGTLLLPAPDMRHCPRLMPTFTLPAGLLFASAPRGKRDREPAPWPAFITCRAAAILIGGLRTTLTRRCTP